MGGDYPPVKRLYSNVSVLEIPFIAIPSVPSLITASDNLAKSVSIASSIEFIYAAIFDGTVSCFQCFVVAGIQVHSFLSVD